MNLEFESLRTREKDLQAYKEAFDYYDWNKSGIISVKVNFVKEDILIFLVISWASLIFLY